MVRSHVGVVLITIQLCGTMTKELLVEMSRTGLEELLKCIMCMKQKSLSCLLEM